MAPTVSAKKRRDFDPKKFLATIGEGRKVVAFSRKQTIFTQGDAAEAVFFIQQGKVMLTVVSKIGKEATLGILSEGEFLGEGGLAGQPLRMGSATAMTDCELLQSLAQQQFRLDTGGRLVFVPFGPRRRGYYVEAGDEPKLKALVTMYFLARSLVYLLGSTATFMFTQSLLSDERTSPLRRKLELGFTLYSISAVFLYILPALPLWKTYQGLVERLCSLLATVLGIGSPDAASREGSSNSGPVGIYGGLHPHLGSGACTGHWSPLRLEQALSCCG